MVPFQLGTTILHRFYPYSALNSLVECIVREDFRRILRSLPSSLHGNSMMDKITLSLTRNLFPAIWFCASFSQVAVHEEHIRYRLLHGQDCAAVAVMVAFDLRVFHVISRYISKLAMVSTLIDGLKSVVFGAKIYFKE